MLRALAAVCVGIAVFCSPALSEQFSLQRGYQNYGRLAAGDITFESLSETERNEVIAIVRALQSTAPEGASEECESAYSSAGSAADELASKAQRLKICAENRNFSSDDCSTEMRRARSAHSDYESAVSNVQSECN